MDWWSLHWQRYVNPELETAMKYNPDADKVDHSIQIDKLYDRIRELSMPCKKIFGWVPESMYIIAGIIMLILIIIAAGTLARQFILFIFSAFDLNMNPYGSYSVFFHGVAFCFFAWVLGRGVDAIDREAREKVNELNKGQILAIRARIQFLESKSKQ